jgi:hypothetical protein
MRLVNRLIGLESCGFFEFTPLFFNQEKPMATLPEIKVLTDDVVELFETQQRLNEAMLESIGNLETALREIKALLTPDDSRG